MEYGEDAAWENNNGERIYKDHTKPDGEACWDDGMLKDASEMEWPDSPSDSNPQNLNLEEKNVILKRKLPGDENESGYDNDELLKAKVSYNSILWEASRWRTMAVKVE